MVHVQAGNILMTSGIY